MSTAHNPPTEAIKSLRVMTKKRKARAPRHGDIEVMAAVRIGTDHRCDTGTTEALGVSNAQAVWDALYKSGYDVVER